MNNPYEITKKVQIETRGRIIIALYSQAIHFLVMAKDGVEEGQYVESTLYLNKAEGILNTLIGSLNIVAGQITQNFFEIYQYMVGRLKDVNQRKDISSIGEVLEMLKQLKKSWEIIL